MPVMIQNSSGASVHLDEESSGVATVAFTDEDGNAVTPNSIKWSLVDDDGDTINNRDQVDFTPVASSVEILLSGDDLAIQEAETAEISVKRHIVIEATYNSATHGNNIPLKEQGTFYVDNLKKIA